MLSFKSVGQFATCAIMPAAAILSAFIVSAPAEAQRMTDAEREQAYYSCRSEYVARNMGDDDAANAYCYNKYYDETPYMPQPQPPCQTFENNCTRPY